MNNKDDIYKIDDDEDDYEEEPKKTVTTTTTTTTYSSSKKDDDDDDDEKKSGLFSDDLKGKLIKYGIIVFIVLIVLLLLVALFFPKGSKKNSDAAVEKAITLNSDELNKAVNLANEKKLILAEAMTIYNMPIYNELEKIINSGKLGNFRLAQVNFGSFKEYDMTNRFFNMDLAGGALLDIGVYALSCVRMFMTEYPDDIKSQVKFAVTGADEQSNIILKNSKEELASVTLSLHAKQPKRATICYDNGYIEIFEYPRADTAMITYTEDNHTEIIKAGDISNALCYEIENMENAVSNGNNTMRLGYTIDVMKIMTTLRKDWNMKYPEEQSEAL